jgi:putative redox protein
MQTGTVKWTGREEFVYRHHRGIRLRLMATASNAAPSPMEMLLFGLGHVRSGRCGSNPCQKKTPDTHFARSRCVRGECGWRIPALLGRRSKWSTGLAGELDERAVRDSIELSQNKYCSVAAMLGKTAKITCRYEITQAKA